MRILIVEDEAVAARRLERLTRQILVEGVEQISLARGLPAARSALAAERFDLILLDLNLSGDDGFDLLAGDIGRARLIIVSAHPDRAIEAFGHAALDFVPKPVTEDRLRAALDRFRRALVHAAPERLIVRNSGRVDIIDLDAIVRIAGADDYSEILLESGRTLLSDRRLAQLAAELPAEFVRVHRSFIANLRHASALDQTGGQAALAQSGGVVTPVSRRSLAKVRARMQALFEGAHPSTPT